MHIKKMIAPIIITTLLIIYFAFFALNWYYIPSSKLGILVGITISLALIGVSIYVLIERIKEIRSGEEDELLGAAEVIVYGTAVKFI